MLQYPQPLILASGSMIRKQLLQRLNIPFEVVTSHVDEDAIKATISHLPLSEQACRLAEAKALAVSSLYPEAYVIGADQMAECDGRRLDKPQSHANASKHLAFLQGKSHYQHSALAIAHNEALIKSAVDTATLTMRPLSPQQIEDYLLLDKPYQSSGAYHYEEHGAELFENIQGTTETILGLPLHLLATMLQEAASHFPSN